MAIEKNVRVTINFSKEVVPITCTLEKRFFAVAVLLKVGESFLFRQSKKTCDILWSV